VNIYKWFKKQNKENPDEKIASIKEKTKVALHVIQRMKEQEKRWHQLPFQGIDRRNERIRL